MSTPIGSYLRNLRLRAGLRQQELAESVGYDASHVSGVEVGRKNPSPEFLDRVASCLHLDAAGREDMGRELADSPTSIQLIPDLPTDEYRMYAELSRKLGKLTPGQIEMIRKIVRLDDEIRSRPAYEPQRIKRRPKEEIPM